MEKPRLVIYGIGPLGRLMHYYFSCASDYTVAAFCADRAFLLAEEFCGLPALAFEDLAQSHPPADFHLFVAIGYKRMRDRQRLFERAKAAGYTLANFTSPRAAIHPPCELGENNVFMDQVLIEPFATIGDNNIFWSGTIVSHDCVVGSHNYLSAKVILGGRSKLADGCFLGNGACTINDIDVGPEAMLLSGAYALRDCTAFTKYLGNPARAIGTHREDGIVIERG